MYDFRSRPRFLAECDCGWRCEAKNAHPVAKRHAKKCGKRTRVEITLIYVYNEPGEPKS